MSTKALTKTGPDHSVNEALAAIGAMLSDDAMDYIKEKGTEIGALSAVEQKLVDKAKKLKEKINNSPEALQLATVKAKLKQVSAKRSENVTKVSGVIEQELGKKADDAMAIIFGDAPKQLKG